LPARKGQEGVVRILAGWVDVDPNIMDIEGQTPLPWVAGRGFEGVVRLLG